MKKFEDLEFEKHNSIKGVSEDLLNGVMKKFKGSKQALVTFDNGREMSIIFGELFYSNGIDTYEAWCQDIDDNPRGYLNEEEVTNYMIIAQS